MTKKYIIFITLGILLIISSIFFVLKQHQPVIDSLFKAIPGDAAFIIDIKDYSKFRSDINTSNKTWHELTNLHLFAALHKHISLIDSLQNTSGFLKDFLSNSPSILISGHQIGKNNLQLLYCIKVESTRDFYQITKIFEKTPGSVISERKYEGISIIDVLLSSQKENLSVCYTNGVLFISKSPILIENAVRKISAGNQNIADKGLDEIIKSAGKNTLVNFYLNYNSLPLLGQHFLHPRYQNKLEFLSSFGNWVELDLNVKPDILIFNGFSSSLTQGNSLHSVFTNQKPQKLEMFGKIPANANTFAIMALSNIDQYLKAYQEFLASRGLKNNFNRTDSLKNTYSINLLEDFIKIFENEAGVVFTESANDSAQHIVTLFRVKNNEIAEKTLNNWVEAYAEASNISAKQAIQEIPFDDDFSAKIYRLHAANIPATILGSMFEAEGNEYCILSDNYMIFGNSPGVLKAYTRNILSNSTLNTDIAFNEFSEYFSSQTNFFFYNKPSLSTSILDTYLKQDLVNSLKKQPAQLNSLQAFVFQFNVNNDGNIYNNIFIKYAPAKIDNTPKTTWETKLDGICTVKPTMVKNHLTGETEIIAQDDKNNIYLINKLGRILWKQNIEEPILSEIYQIDYHRNRKLQYLFNTASKLYIVDRNGNPLENFPVRLKEKATNGLSVFDYDKNRVYRIFIACADQKVYMLEKDGKLGNGWTPKETEGTVTMPIQHFRFNAADYIVFNDDHKVYIVNRKGKDRVKPDTEFPISLNNKVMLVKNKNAKASRFGVTDTSGRIYLIDTKGKTSTIDLGKYPSGHYFDVLDIDADGNSEFILTSGRNISLFSQKNEKVLQIVTDSPISHKPLFYEFSTNKYKIGVVTNENEKIYLYSSNGELYKGFPLRGNSQFSIGLLNNSENRFNLIVGSNRNFLYNYSVQ